MSFVIAFRDALINAGCPYAGHINFETQKYHTFNSEGICKKKCCRYRIFENEIGAHIVCWRRGIDITWFYKDYKLLTNEEKAKFNKERQQQLDLKEKIRREAISQAKEYWVISDEINPEHPYILKKKIIPYGARGLNSAIILPCYDSRGEIQSTQRIWPDGTKKFQGGAPIKGSLMVLGETLTQTILICEGWATGCSLHEATGNMVIVAFSSSNMIAVAPFLKYRFKGNLLVYCADKDQNKIGERYSIEACKITKGLVILPVFKESDNVLTDFNDVHVRYGMETLQQQLNIGG